MHLCRSDSFLLLPLNPPTDSNTSSGPPSPGMGHVWAFESGEELSKSHCPYLCQLRRMYL